MKTQMKNNIFLVLFFMAIIQLTACSNLTEYEYKFKNESTEEIIQVKIRTPFRESANSEEKYSDEIFSLISPIADPEFFLANPGSDSKTIYSSYDTLEFEWVTVYDDFKENYYAEINGSKVIFRDKKR